MLPFLNILFFVLHTGLVLFNLFGWAFKRTRVWNLAALLATLFLWTVMGFWKGFGYCLCTDWHWQVRQGMGIEETSSTYIHLLILKLTGLDLPDDTVFWITAGGFVFALVMSLGLNFRDWLRHSQTGMPPG